MAYTVGDVSKLAHVSVRTLHHYDEVGLLRPSGRTDAGYRLYTPDDLEQLQQVLFYKELGFSLEEIRDVMAHPDYDRREALVVQRELIDEQITRLSAMRGLIDKTLLSLEGGIGMSDQDMFEVFGDFDPAEYEDEVKERWGETDAYKESARRTRGYTKADWQRFKDESEEITLAIAALLDEGVPATDPRAMDAIDRHRQQIDQWFYPCSYEMHEALGQMWVTDQRFTKNIDKTRPGLAQYMCDAAKANAERARASDG